MVQHHIQEWNSILTIHLLKGANLPSMDTNGETTPAIVQWYSVWLGLSFCG